MKIRHLIFAVALVVTPLAAVCFGFCWPVLVWRACYRSGKQNAATAKPRIIPIAIETGDESHLYRKESFFASHTEVVPKQAEVRAFKGENSMSQ